MIKKNDKGFKTIICLGVAIVAVSVAAIALNGGRKSDGEQVQTGSELVVTGETKVQRAVLNEDGTYTLRIKEQGYKGDVVLEAVYSADGKTLLSYDVVYHKETPDLGSKVDEDEYKNKLSNLKLPIAANGMDISSILGVEAVAPSGTALVDGTYTAETTKDENGSYNYATITIEGGKITSVVWDEIMSGASKAELSANGQYVMKPVWKTQSESLGKYVVDHQTTEGIMNAEGRTDAVTGVSIYVGGFVDLTNKAIEKANGQNGVYTVESEKDDKGDYGYVMLTVENGKISNVIWDEITGGASKADLSTSGKYVMVPVWKTQSELLGQYVVEHQTTEGILNEAGYTDVVSSVSIYAGGFVELTNGAIAKAAAGGVVPGAADNGVDATKVEVVSGATVSSKAVIRAIDEGYAWLADYLAK